MLSISVEENRVGFRTSGMWIGGQEYMGDELLSAEQAAEYLWTRFTDNLA